MRVLAVLVAASTSAVLVAQTQTPQFRAGVDVVRIEITVLDARTRQPVRGLKADDFVVTVNGDVQPIATVAEVDGSRVVSTAPVALANAARDVNSNVRRPSRTFVVVMNDSVGSSDPWERRTGIAIAHRIVDALGPDDVAAVLFNMRNYNDQDFTADRTLLREAINTFNPVETISVPNRLGSAVEFLSRMPGYRRAVFYVSADGRGRATVASNLDNSLDVEDIEGTVRLSDVAGSVGVALGGRAAHIPVYGFSTTGLAAPTADDINNGRTRSVSSFHSEEAFRTIARASGGRAIVETNAPAAEVPAVFEELSSYYTLGYENTHPIDRKLRWLQVEVKRPDVLVMPTNVPFSTAGIGSRSRLATTLTAGRESGLVAAMRSPLPSGAIPMQLSPAAFAMPGARDHALVLSLGLAPRASYTTSQQYRLKTHVFSAEGRRELMFQEQVLTLPADRLTTESPAEVLLRLPLRSGRYNVRMYLEHTVTLETGSVFASLTIPDFARDELSVSGVAISHSAGRAIGGREAVSDLLPLTPTVVRTFAAADRVRAFLRIHQPRGKAVPVTLETELVGPDGAVMSAATRTIGAPEFGSGRGVDHSHDLPLSKLERGEYLLRFVATTRNTRVQRDVRFSVR